MEEGVPLSELTTPLPDNRVRFVKCQVCQTPISMKEKEHQRIIKCPNCQEGTPIKPPPVNKKYVRCACNALLTCSVSSNFVMCPRKNCQRKLKVNDAASERPTEFVNVTEQSNKELSPATMDSFAREERLQNELAQMRQNLDKEIRLRQRKEQELRDNERILAELLDSEEQRTQNIVEKDELDKTESATNLREKGFQNEIPQHDRQTGEAEVVGELRRRLEEEHQQKTELEERLRRLELRMEEERTSHLSTERELRSAVFAAEDALAEYQRHQSRDWIIQREEVVLSEKILGKGAWGHVSEGAFRGCQVAVKAVHELILSDYNRRLFEREMSIASRCRHPNLLQFIGATNDEGSPLFVTELLETSLRQILILRALNHDEIIIIALDVAKGLNYLHLSSPLPIMHRDISSANVLLWRRDNSWRAKLSDYGSANVLRQCMTVNAGAIIYSTPEAFTPRQSTKVDVYSFGVLLCEMCIREQPDPQELHSQIGRVIQDAVRGLIQWCVKTNPDARPTMSEVIHELEQLVQKSIVSCI